MLFYRASVPLSRQTLKFAAGIIRRHRISIGSLRRKLNPGQQALLVLVYLRKDETFASLAAGFGSATPIKPVADASQTALPMRRRVEPWRHVHGVTIRKPLPGRRDCCSYAKTLAATRACLEL